MNYEFKRGGRHRRSFRRPRYAADDDPNRESKKRHPPGLRGRDIGLWYANQNSQDNKTAKNNFPSLAMNTEQANSVNESISILSRGSGPSSRTDWGSRINSTPSRSFQSNFHDSRHAKQNSQEQISAGKTNSLTRNVERVNLVTATISTSSRASDLSSRTDWSSEIDLLTSKSFLRDSLVSSESETKNSIEEVDIFDRMESIEESDFKSMYMKNILGNKRKIEEKSKEEPMKEFKFAKTISLDQERYEELIEKRNCDKYIEMMKFRKKLPSYNMKEGILSVINRNQAVVLSGETGCGKTTQVPQFLLDDIIERKESSTCRIICTQPRRISAISVSKRVADERAEPLGINVGYQIRLEKVMPRPVGSILYCTTGIVLQWLQTDPFLSEISHLIIDEVHERDALSDFLLCVSKDILPYRPDLKVILMSATLNADQFSQYFGNCPKIHIPGYTFPVDEYYLEDVIEKLRFSYPEISTRKKSRDLTFQKVLAKIHQMDKYSAFTINELEKEQSEDINYDLVVELLRFINRQEAGAILVFLPGWAEISGIHKMLEKDKELGYGRCLVIPLHSMMPTVNQREVFDRPPKGIRKIVLATNIAETSITIDDVVYVIDCGKIKIKNYNKESKVATLQSEWVALANARQRMGRAGRVQDGICYHLYTNARKSLFDDYALPEIQRTRLEEVVLNVKILQLGYCEKFLSKIMEPPDIEVLQISLQLLKSISALDNYENLTPLGYHLARLPVDPFIGKMLLIGSLFSCVNPILTIAATLAFKDPFIIPLNREREVDEIKRMLDKGKKSDHLVLVTIYDDWSRAVANGREQKFCWDHFLSSSVMRQLSKLRNDFMNILHNHKFTKTSNPNDDEVNRNSRNFAVVRAVITAGLYPNVARIMTGRTGRAKGFFTADSKVQIHPKSVNAKVRHFETQWIVYWEKMHTDKVYLYDTTMVNNLSLLFFGEKIDYDHKLGCISVDTFLKVKCDKNIYTTVQKLRNELDSLLEHRISHPSVTNWDRTCKEGYLLRLIKTLLSDEHLP